MRTLLISLLLCTPSVVGASSVCSDAQCSTEGESLDASALIQIAATPDAVPDLEVNVDVKNNDKSVSADKRQQHMKVHLHDQAMDITEPNGTVHHFNLTDALNVYKNKLAAFATPATYGQRLLFALTSWAIYVVFAMMIWYCCYPAPPVPVANSTDIEEPSETFNNGHFQCLKNSGICLCACLCPGLRWADTMSLVGFLKISTALTAAFFCAFLNGFAETTAVFGPFTVALALYYRHKLREEFALDAWTCKTCVIDAVYLIFCPWCALAQEARVVTHAAMKGQLKSQEVSY